MNGTFFVKLALAPVVTLFVIALFWSDAVFEVGSAQATSSAPVLVLTVKNMDNEPVIAAVNDEPLRLEWYVDGPVTNCVIIQDNSVSGQTPLTSVNTASLPETGSIMVTPPANSTTNYVLNCDANVAEVPVNTDPPVVTMSVDQGLDLVNNALTGHVDNALVRWSSVNATRCSYVSRVSSSTAVTETYSGDVSNILGTSGWIRYDGNPREIHETTTFNITCYNDNTGAEDTGSITINVSNPPGPGAPMVTVGSPDYPSVERDALYGYAYVDVWYTSNNVTSCARRAYYPDGVTEYSLSGWSHSGTSYTSFSFTNIQVATTTIFEVTCSRGAVTIGGVPYPATSSTDRILINVNMPGNVGDVNTWDRSTLPPVAATLTASPNPTTKVALTGYAAATAEVYREYASYCYLKAYQFSTLSGDYTNEYSLSNWTRTLNGNGTSTYNISVATTTRLVADCWRDYDRQGAGTYSSAAEIDNGHEVVETLLLVSEPSEAAPAPKLYLYGNATVWSASRMYTTGISNVGYSLGYDFLEHIPMGESTNSITFNFDHPFNDEDEYDIWVNVCDEVDGASTYNLYVEGVLVGSMETDKTINPAITSCGSSGAFSRQRIATGVDIADNDEITLECISRDDGERCTHKEVAFGAPGAIATPQVNPVVTQHEVPVLVIAENTTFCGGGGLGAPNSHTAYRLSDMSIYDWWAIKSTASPYYDSNNYGTPSGSHSYTFHGIPIATTSKLTLGCWRTGDGEVDEEELNIYVPYKTSLSAETTIGVGQCIDDGTFGSFGSSIEAPPGYGPDTDGWCSPMVDLESESPAVSIGSATEDNVNGQYDNLPVLIVVRNIGPGELVPSSNISYKAVLEVMPVFGLPDIESGVGLFNGGLGLPVPSDSPTLTRVIDNVPFGTHTVCSRVNLDGIPDNYPEASSDYTNNTSCTTITLPVPRPPMTISADRELIRNGQSASIDWGVNVTYELQCAVQGPGGLNQSFNTLMTGPAYTDSFTTMPLTATGEYLLTCTEPITGTTFIEKERVEMVPDVEEI
ncbi:hypothetical protein KC902_00640 [Candidatus Kaiserbacteria bacterium]|nr:hypothetical protein [Candidatus Kaiserbacteria bacterium]